MPESRHNGPAASLRRIRLIMGHTLGAALHQRLTLLLVILGVGLIGWSLVLREFNFGTAEPKFLGDFGLGVIGFFGLLLAVLAPVQLFFAGIENRSAYCVLSRPVRRWEYLTGLYAGVAALLAIFVAGLALVLAVIIATRAAALHTAFVSLPVFLQACALVWLRISLVAAMTLFVSSYAGSALFATCAGLLLAVIAHLRPFAPDAGTLSWLRGWPNLGLFDVDALLTAGQSPAIVGLSGLLAYWAVYVVLFTAFASYAFRRREF